MKIRLLEGVSSVEEILSHGSKIGVIQLKRFAGDDYDPLDSQHLLLDYEDIEEDLQDKRFFTYYLLDELECDIFVKLFKDKEEIFSLWHRSHGNEIFEMMKKPAEFGDLNDQMTKVDKKIRKGFDIKFGEEINGYCLEIYDGLLNMVEKKFSDLTGYLNIEVSPYKYNIYEKGDFFSAHQDSPNENLLATIVYVIEGQRGSFYLNGEEINDSPGNIIIFYPEITHEVKPVTERRVTITFKVFYKNSGSNLSEKGEFGEEVGGRLPKEDLSERAVILGKKISSGDAILLEGGYSFFQDQEVFVPKGKDETLISTLRELGYQYRLQPVILENIVSAIEENKYSSDDYDQKSKVFTLSNIPNDKDFKIFPRGEEFNGEDFNKEIIQIKIYNINDTLKKFFGVENDIPQGTRIFYQGLGYKVGEIMRINPHIGNEYMGHILTNIYYNLVAIIY